MTPGANDQGVGHRDSRQSDQPSPDGSDAGRGAEVLLKVNMAHGQLRALRRCVPSGAASSKCSVGPPVAPRQLMWRCSTLHTPSTAVSGRLSSPTTLTGRSLAWQLRSADTSGRR
jgi:hypothetical protein